MSRCVPLLATALAGCTFYISGGTGDAGGGSDAWIGPDGGGDAGGDAASDTITPPLGDALPPFDMVVPVDGPFDAFVPPDIVIPPFDAPVPIDAGPPGWVVVETLTVPCAGATITSQTTLLAGTSYRFRASGQCTVDTFLNIRADAEYQGVIVPRDKVNGIDTGIAINDVTLGANKQPHWGNYTATHVYEVARMGLGATITARYHDSANTAYGNNAGTLTLEILAQQ